MPVLRVGPASFDLVCRFLRETSSQGRASFVASFGLLRPSRSEGYHNVFGLSSEI